MGLSRRGISARVSSGELKRLCRGWYADELGPAEIAQAISYGGRLGCLSACRMYGLWVPPDGGGIHVVYGDGFAPTPRAGVSFHACQRSQPSTPMWGLAESLEQVLTRHDAEAFMIVAESALSKQLIHVADVRGLIRSGPVRRRKLDEYLAWAESGSETRVRLFLQQRRVSIRAQVVIDGLGRVDLLAGGRLIIECDSGLYHSSPEQQARDRRRDLRARELGYDTLRLSYEQIWHRWDETREIILRFLRRRRHRSGPVAC